MTSPAPPGGPIVERAVLEQLGTKEFSRALAAAATGVGSGGEALRQEAVRRIGAGELPVRDLQTVLLEIGGGWWQPARESVVRRLHAQPELAPSLLSVHSQIAGLPAAYPVEAPLGLATEPGHRCSMALDLPTGTVTGPERTAATKKAARQLAAAALLGHLAGLPEADLLGVGNEAARGATGPGRRLPSPESATDDTFDHGWEDLSPERFAKALRAVLHLALPPGGLTEALARQADAGGIGPGDWWALLQRPPSPGWAPLQVIALAAAARVPGMAAGIVNHLRQIEQAPPVDFDAAQQGPAHLPEHVVTASLRLRRGVVTGRPGVGRSKRLAVDGALASLIAAVACLPDPPEPGGRRAASPGAEVAPAEPVAVVPSPRGPQLAGEPAGWTGAVDAVAWAVEHGCGLTSAPALPGRLVLYRPDGHAVSAGRPPLPVEAVTVDVVLAAPVGAVQAAGVSGWSVPLDMLLPVVLAAGPDAHRSVAGWAAVVEFAVRVVAAGAVVPAIDPAGRDVWRPAPSEAFESALAEVSSHLAPESHAAVTVSAPLCVQDSMGAAGAVVDEVVELLVRGPGAALLHGPGAFASPAAVQDPQVQAWADGIERSLDHRPDPVAVLIVGGPVADEAGEVRLPVRVGTDPQVEAAGEWVQRPLRRVLRRAAAGSGCGPLERLAYAGALEGRWLSVEEAGELVDPGVAGRLGEAGVRIVWPGPLVGSLGSHTVIGTGSAGPDGRGLSMDALLDWRWQVTLDGVDLSEEEMDLLAEAHRPLVRLRDRWLLVDPVTLARVRHRVLEQLPTRRALTSVLAGALSVGGEVVVCRPADGLALVVEALRAGERGRRAVPAPAGLKADLRPYQQRGLEWLAGLAELRLCPVLADDMGLGKTLQTLAFVLHRIPAASGPVLVVSTTSMLDQWQAEAARFAPSLAVVRHHGAGRRLPVELPAGTVVLTSYGTLARDAEVLAARSWDLVVADEAHLIAGGDGRAARAMRSLTAKDRLALTGTPVNNRSSELWRLLDWLNPGLFGTLSSFQKLIGRHTDRDAGAEQARLLRRLTGPFVLRRLKTDPEIAPDLPEKIRTLHPVELSTEQTALYEALVRETLEDLSSRPRRARSGRVLALLHSLRTIVNDPSVYLGEDPGQAAADLDRARERSAKLDELLRIVDVARRGGEQMLVCVNYVRVGHLLAGCLTAAGHGAAFFHGGLSAKERQQLVEDFQTGRLPVLVLSVKAGGTGLTLTAATQVVHYDSPWTSSALEQASDRAYRIGQTRTVHVRRLLATGTVEERIDQLVSHKGDLADAVVPSGEMDLTHLDDHALSALVSLGSR
ncbi:DEAD/DEAH box helicase [Kitasatospora sp. NPDC002965]|uniref:DEAD/DEAH box helicase n=1 Tax=Kitasatospora sp. NPDC002965 TaxID=3154775 RepID=UPI0033A98E1A